ncbi:hypothetical protein GCM10010185_54520 [Saccharothrix coeruleofusca]|uniref:Uncharacterized protein n=1 Tax=Saccharothrix coeruleofusca TaxID=33919 RepID=A0A918EFK8_9PSEU|nr:hypothetical protein GCM10010185_54520 [Saccharothrix coeruleofusca]
MLISARKVLASANLPTILHTLFWRRFNATGSLFFIYGGLVPAADRVLASVPSGPDPIIDGIGFHLFPLSDPGLVSIPLSFLPGYPGDAVLGRDRAVTDRAVTERSDEPEGRSMTGIGVGVSWRSCAGAGAPARRRRPGTPAVRRRRSARRPCR